MSDWPWWLWLLVVDLILFLPVNVFCMWRWARLFEYMDRLEEKLKNG